MLTFSLPIIATLTDAYQRSRLPIIAAITEALDSDMDPGARKDRINALRKLIWHGNTFDSFDLHAFEKASGQLKLNLNQVRQMREEFTPSRVAKPISRRHRFEPDELRAIHNGYLSSLSWMPSEVRQEYENL